MFSAATGESLKDIKDRLNIRKRGTNARTAAKEKSKAAAAAAVTAVPSASPKPPTAPERPVSNAPVRRAIHFGF
jgi:hypothetical protein